MINTWARSTFTALSDRQYRTLWLGTTIAFLAFAMSNVAQGVVAFDITGKNGQVGIVALGQLRVVPHLATAVPWMRANRTLSVPLFFNFALTSGPQYLAFAIAPIVSSLRQLGLARAAFVPFGAMGIMLQSAPMVLLPNAAHRSADSVKRLARRVALLLGGIAVLWGVVVLATPARVGTRLLGADWQATRPAQAAYAFMVLAQALAIGPAVALRVLERPRSLVRVRLVAMPAVLILGVVLAHRYGAPGTASAVLAGEAITAVGLTWTVTRLRPDSDTRSETGRARAVVEHSRAKNNPSILIVTTVPATMNGFLLPYIEHLGDCGWQVDLATGPGSVAARARAVHEVPWTRSPKDVLQLLRSARVMRSILVEGRFDIVHVHTPIAAAITRGSVATMRRSSRPSVVYTAHGFHFMPGQSLRRRLPPQIAERMAGRYTNRLVVINETDRASAQRLRLVQSRTIVQMPGIGVDLDWYNETPELLAASWAIRDQLAMKRGDVLITMIGELFERKGPQDAVEALALASHENVHLAIAGTGPTREALELQIQTLGLSDRVHLMGQMPDVRPLLLASRATTLPSYREGLSRAVLESLALGIPVLGSDIRGIADSVPPDGGLLFAPGDVVAIAKAFDAIAEAPFFDEAGRLRLRRRLEQYSITSLIDRHDALYEDLLLERTQR